MNMNAIVKKLRLKPGIQALLLNAPKGYLEKLAPLPEGVTVSTTKGSTYPFVQMFVTQLVELKRSFPSLFRAATPGGLVWIAYPKKTSGVESDLDRDTICAVVEGSGWRPVSIVSIDDVWSALRFRPEAEVKRR